MMAVVLHGVHMAINQDGKDKKASKIVRENKQSQEYWDKKLADEGLFVITENHRPKRQIPMYKAPANEDSKLARGNAHGGINETVEYYTMLKHYCVQRNFRFREIGKMPSKQRRYFRFLLLNYCDGKSVPKAYMYIKAKAERLGLETPNSQIYFFKKVQAVKESFIKDFALFSQYMQYLKYSWTANPKTWLQFKQLETLLPGYHDVD